MKDKLIHVFEYYKFNEDNCNDLIEANLGWLKKKLSSKDFEKLMNQFFDSILNNERQLFINCYKYAWGFFRNFSFEVYRYSKYYEDNPLELNLNWLRDILDNSDVEKLEKYLYAILLEDEEKCFLNYFQYAWETLREILL